MTLHVTPIPTLNPVTGPGPTTDNAIARMNGTSGLLLGDYTSGAPTAGDTGIILTPGQPMMLVQAGAQANVTGAGTVYTITWPTEILDQGGIFASPTLTVPAGAGGQWHHAIVLFLTGLDEAAATDVRATLVCSSRSIIFGMQRNLQGDLVGLQEVIFSGSMDVDMAATDTASVTVQISGMAGDTADINLNSFWSARLVG